MIGGDTAETIRAEVGVLEVQVGRGTMHISEPRVSQNNSAASEHVAYSCILGTVNLVATISLFGLTHGSFQFNVSLSLSRGPRALYVHCCAHLILGCITYLPSFPLYCHHFNYFILLYAFSKVTSKPLGTRAG